MPQLPTQPIISKEVTEKLKDKKILLIGGGGFVGTHLASLLEGVGADPIIVDKKANVNQMVNILDTAAVNHLVKSSQPWGAIYLTADIYSDPTTQRSLNVDGFNNVVEAILRYMPEARFIGIGTSAEYGIIPHQPVNESFQCKPISPYGETKLEACQMMMDRVDNRGLWGNWIRPSNLIGRQMNPKLIVPKLLEAAKNKRDSFQINDPNAIRDFLDVADFVSLIAAIFTSNRVGQIYNASMGSGISMQELSHLVSEVSGQPIHLQQVASAGVSSDVDYFVADNSKAKKHLGWAPSVSFEESIQSIWESMQ